MLTSLMPWAEDMMRAMNEVRYADGRHDYVTVRQLMRTIQNAADSIIDAAFALEKDGLVFAEVQKVRKEYLARMAANYTEPPTF